MTDRDSSYYPRRANIFSPLLSWVDSSKKMLGKLAFAVPEDFTMTGFLGGLFVPGLAIYLRKRDRSGWAALVICALLALFFFVFLGFQAGIIAFAMLLTIHVVGLVAYCKPLFFEVMWPGRLAGALLLTAGVMGFVYVPLQNFIQGHLFLPLRLHGHVMVVQHLASPGVVRRGEWIAFRVESTRDYFQGGGAHGNVINTGGINLAPVLGLAGDHLQFTNTTFSVNGVSQPRLTNMPTSGDLTVPENCWFVWPEFDISGYGMTPPRYVTDAILGVANVRREQFVGKAFKHWFFRRQSFS